MAVGIRRTRLLLLGACFVLLAAVGAYFYAGYLRQQKLKHDLPKRLGLDIQQDSSGFTISKSQNGHTLFTLHAARAVQFKASGQATLNDVKITIFGPPGSGQQDVISGAEFSYDQKSGEAAATGPVQIDLQGVLAGAAKRAEGEKPTAADRERGTVHAKTTGLTFNQKTGIAETDGHVEFALPKARGIATGAHYDANSGELVLGSDVVLHGLVGGQADTLTAAHAVLERQQHSAQLTHASLRSRNGNIFAEQGTATFNQDGGLEHVAAESGVKLETAQGASATAPRGEADFGGDSAVQQVHLRDGVQFTQPGRDNASTHGSAREAWVHFAANRHADNARLLGSVAVTEALPQQKRTRVLHANELKLKLANGKPTHADAAGSPEMTETAELAKGSQQRTMSGDAMTAKFTSGELREVHARGKTRLAESSSNGAKQESTGDTLDATFRQQGRESALEQAVQRGSVHMKRNAIESGKAVEQTAQAAQATYRSVGDELLLEGNPRLSDGTMEMAGSQMTLHRASNQLDVQGQVKATYAAQGNGEATHILAGTAVVENARHTARFAQGARMWQQSNVLEAPEITLTQTPRGLTATGEGASRVKAHFIQEPQKNARAAQPQPVLVTADRLVYDDAARRADFSGNVDMRNADGTVHAAKMQVFLLADKAAPQQPGMAGRMDRAVAEDGVRLQQTGRTGLGDRLVYTAQNGVFVLTGSNVRPPRLEDRQKGTVVGETITFRSHDDRVDVTGGDTPSVLNTTAGSK